MKRVWLTTKSRYNQSEKRRFAKLRRTRGRDLAEDCAAKGLGAISQIALSVGWSSGWNASTCIGSPLPS
jgi:hypothetical protein